MNWSWSSLPSNGEKKNKQPCKCSFLAVVCIPISSLSVEWRQLGWYVPHALLFSPSLPFLLISYFFAFLIERWNLFLPIWACHCLFLLDPLFLTFLSQKLGGIFSSSLFGWRPIFSNFVPFSFCPRFFFLLYFLPIYVFFLRNPNLWLGQKSFPN